MYNGQEVLCLYNWYLNSSTMIASTIMEDEFPTARKCRTSWNWIWLWWIFTIGQSSCVRREKCVVAVSLRFVTYNSESLVYIVVFTAENWLLWTKTVEFQLVIQFLMLDSRLAASSGLILDYCGIRQHSWRKKGNLCMILLHGIAKAYMQSFDFYIASWNLGQFAHPRSYFVEMFCLWDATRLA